jgi:ribulose kinase
MGDFHKLTRDYHLVTDFHGNRSPLADPNSTGATCGIRYVSASMDTLAIHYLATIQAVCYGQRHVIDAMCGGVKMLNLSGGLCNNDLFVQTLADVTGCSITIPENIDETVCGTWQLVAQ